MWNDLNSMSARELKELAETMWLVKWEDFQANASAKDMIEIIESHKEDENSDSDQVEDENSDSDSEKELFTQEQMDSSILSETDKISWELLDKNHECEKLTKKIKKLEKRLSENSSKKDEEKEEVVLKFDKDNNFIVKSNLKRNGNILKTWDSIEYFEWIEKLVKYWVIELSQ